MGKATSAFWREILRGAVCQITMECFRGRKVILLCKPEIDQYGYILVGEQDVGRFDVVMHDSTLVQEVDTTQQ
jgi:hypothetical protein